MSFKEMSLNALIIQHNKSPYGDLVERLNKEVFSHSADDFDINQALKLLSGMTIRYTHNRDMFDILSKYVLEKFETHSRSIDRKSGWILQVGGRGNDFHLYKEDRITYFLIGLSVYGGKVRQKFLGHFSEEYQMYLEL